MSDHRVAAVDIAAARPSTVVLLDGLRVEEWYEATSVSEAAQWLTLRKPDVIAIDAPCSLSHGLLTRPKDGAKPYAGRVCDLDLMNRSIPLYQVPQDRAEVKSWMEVGYQLYDALRVRGYTLPELASVPGSAIEIYPYASFAALLGRRPLKKSTKEGLAQRAALLRDQGLEWDGHFDHDSLDALVGALTGLRYLEGRAMAVGDPREALLWLPVTELKQSYYSAPTGVVIPKKSPPAAASAVRAPCACGCGSYPKGRNSRFLPGHDAKLLSRQLSQWKQGHLAVAVQGVDPGVHCAEIEKHVVEVLLPALSVEHMPPSQLRGRLLELHTIVVHGIDDLWVAPDPSLSDWRKILVEYGLAFDGYRYAKLVRHRECAEVADEVWRRFEEERRFTSSFADLRCSLFWMQRWVHNAEQSPGWEPSPELEDRVHRLYAAIQEAWRRERLSQP